MRIVWEVLLLFAAAAPGFAQRPAQTATNRAILRSGEVIPCRVDKDCTREMVAGRPVLAMEVDGIAVQASLGEEQRVSYADLTITNGTGRVLDVRPEDFRVEVNDARYKRLSYVEPVGEEHKTLDRRQERLGHGLPRPEYWTSAEHREARQARLAAAASKIPLLPVGAVATGSVVSGRVYFDRPQGTGDRSLILPFQATILEFPFARPAERAKPRKAQRSDLTEATVADNAGPMAR